MTDQQGDYYVMEAVAWIDSVEGLSDSDRCDGRERFAALLAHHDLFLHAGQASFADCLLRARSEFGLTAADPPKDG